MMFSSEGKYPHPHPYKIAIVGMASFDEEIPDDFEVWIIAGYISHFKRYDRVFECHAYEQETHKEVWRSFVDDPWCDFYVPAHLAGLYPKAKLIPTESMAEKYFRSFGSTISYMLIQAIRERPEEIALYGVDMCEEHEGQRPSACYWLGVANGLGIKTTGIMKEETYGIKET